MMHRAPAGWMAVVLLGLFAPALVLSSDSSRIANDPYQGVIWGDDVRLKTQFHDHVGTREDRIAAYDQAGYDVVSLLHYSGVTRIDHAWHERRWPPEDWLSEEFVDSLVNIRFFIPNAEEVGFQHLLSPFLKVYIEAWEPSVDPEKQPHQYGSAQEAIELIRAFGGLPMLAHPINCCRHLRGYHAVEVYNAHPAYEFWAGEEPLDGNEAMVRFWDQQLRENPTLYGIAVNDWYGPWARDWPYSPPPPASLVDSGKTIVVAHDDTPEAFREAVEAGAMFAVRDLGKTKDQYPQVERIVVAEDIVKIHTADSVTWISNGQKVGNGRAFNVSILPHTARYLRAEVHNADGSIVYTQPWALQPAGKKTPAVPGDADQDGDFDQIDLVRVMQGAKYLTGRMVTWGEGDWNRPGGESPASPQRGDGIFDQRDIVVALQAGDYRRGSYPAARPNEAPIIEYVGGGGVGSLGFGLGASAGFESIFPREDLTMAGPLRDASGLKPIELVAIPVPEPPAAFLACMGLIELASIGLFTIWWPRTLQARNHGKTCGHYRVRSHHRLWRGHDAAMGRHGGGTIRDPLG